MRICVQLIGAIFATPFIGVVSLAHANNLSRSVTAHGLTVHYGVVPASKAGAHGSKARNVSATGPDAYHRTVAIFDAASGRRVTGPTVLASVKGSRSHDTQFHAKPVRKRLDVVKVGGAVTYGDDFDMPWSGIDHVDLSVTQKDRPTPTNIRFNYDHYF